MARSVTIKSIDRRASRTYVRVGKTEVEIPCTTKADLRAWVSSQPVDISTDEGLLVLGLKIYLEKDPEMTNPSAIVGKTITVDLAGRVNYPDSVVRVA